MIIFFWVVCLIFLLASLVIVGLYLVKNPAAKESFQILTNGINQALENSGLAEKPKYELELYVWEMTDHVICKECEDCHERVQWGAMDIADWMALGMPGTPEAETQCGEHCQCKLVRYNPAKHGPRHQNK